MLLALTREVSPTLGACELTHLPRVAIDIDVARRQHHAYEAALAATGCSIERLPSGPDIPDAVFVEDIAVVFDELAIITRPGAESRRAETDAVRSALHKHRPLHIIQAPGTIDGGDVLVVDRRVYIGCSRRTNEHAIAQVRQILTPHGYTVCEIPVTGCLHLKSAATALGEGVLLVNPDWVNPALFAGLDFVPVDGDEAMAANALRVGGTVIYPTVFPRTAALIERRGFSVLPVDASELAKAEGAVTCCSLIIDIDTHRETRSG